MSKKNAISYVKNEPPAFIQKFKEKIGYKEEPDVNAKVTLQLVEHSHSLTVTDWRRQQPLLLLPCKEPNTLRECISVPLENFEQCRATHQVLYVFYI
jgi:hypothetical protein